MATADTLRTALTAARDDLMRQGLGHQEAGDRTKAAPYLRAGAQVETLLNIGVGMDALDDHLLARRAPRRRRAAR